MYGEEINLSNRIRMTAELKSLAQDFDCGNEVMNRYLKEQSFDDSKATTFIIKDNDTDAVICYYSLSCSGLVVNTNNGNKFNIYPSVEIKMFAVDEKYQHIPQSAEPDSCSLSDMLLYEVIAHINDFTENECGADKIILYSVPKAESFYSRNMFCRFEDYMKTSVRLVYIRMYSNVYDTLINLIGKTVACIMQLFFQLCRRHHHFG